LVLALIGGLVGWIVGCAVGLMMLMNMPQFSGAPSASFAEVVGELGTFGMFEIYRGVSYVHRIANLRLVLA
jgi:hypothetical protein